MKIKLKSLVLGFAILVVAIAQVQAQEDQSIARVQVEEAKMVSFDRVTGSVEISVSLTNQGGAQPEVFYSVDLTKYEQVSEEEATIKVVDTKVYPEVLSLSEGATIEKSISYTAPGYLQGDYELQVSFSNSKGTNLALAGIGKLNFAGSGQYLEVVSDSCYLTVTGEQPEEKYDLSQGVDVSVDEELRLNCEAISHLAGQVSLVPEFSTYHRNIFGKVEATNQVEQISFGPNEKKTFSITVPKVVKPQAYDAVLIFKNQDQRASNQTIIHYVLSGASATIKNVRLDKDEYKQGETAKLTVDWAGSADSFAGSRLGYTPMDNLSLEISMESQGGSCAQSAKQAVGVEPGSSKQEEVSLNISQNCSDPTATVLIKDKEGNVLDESIVKIETLEKDSEKTAVSKTVVAQKEEKKNNTMDYIVISVIIIVLGIVIYLVVTSLKRKDDNNVFVLFLIIGGATLLLGVTSQAEASFNTTVTVKKDVKLCRKNCSPKTYESGCCYKGDVTIDFNGSIAIDKDGDGHIGNEWVDSSDAICQGDLISVNMRAKQSTCDNSPVDYNGTIEAPSLGISKNYQTKEGYYVHYLNGGTNNPGTYTVNIYMEGVFVTSETYTVLGESDYACKNAPSAVIDYPSYSSYGPSNPVDLGGPVGSGSFATIDFGGHGDDNDTGQNNIELSSYKWVSGTGWNCSGGAYALDNILPGGTTQVTYQHKQTGESENAVCLVVCAINRRGTEVCSENCPCVNVYGKFSDGGGAAACTANEVTVACSEVSAGVCQETVCNASGTATEVRSCSCPTASSGSLDAYLWANPSGYSGTTTECAASGPYSNLTGGYNSSGYTPAGSLQYNFDCGNGNSSGTSTSKNYSCNYSCSSGVYTQSLTITDSGDPSSSANASRSFVVDVTNPVDPGQDAGWINEQEGQTHESR